MKRNGKKFTMPKGVMTTIVDEKGNAKSVPLTSDIWSRMTNMQRYDLLRKCKEEEKEIRKAKAKTKKEAK